jgi:hypothetical protein
LEDIRLTITADVQPFLNALQSLSEFPPEVIDRFIGAVEAGSEVASVHMNSPPASRAGDLRIVLQPSDLV